MFTDKLDAILWSISRAYRRRKIRQSRVYADLMQEHPEIARFDYRISDKERAMLGEATKTQTKLLAMQLHRAGRISDDALVAALDLDTPAILARGRASDQRSLGARDLLVEKLTDEAMMHGSWPSVYARACLACSAGDHGMYGQGACLCPCHREGAA